MQSIDWGDFAVVETIEFYEDEDFDLPMPLTLNDVIRMSKSAQHEELVNAAQEAQVRVAQRE